MADEKNTIEKLEERLTNAAAKFKEMKCQLDDKNKENEELKIRISELEDELTLNGGAKEEVDGLKARLEKAKEIFATQKAKIAEMTEINTTRENTITELVSQKEELEASNKELLAKLEAVEESHDDLYTRLQKIAEIANI